jgi:hypothetical protein
MADQKKLRVTIDPHGKVTVKVECVPGASCTGTSEFLERAMGGVRHDRTLTAEYYETAAAHGVAGANESGE